MKVILSSKWETYILIAGFALFAVGVFFAGQYTAGMTVTANTKAVYDQGFLAGEATGKHEMQNQCTDTLTAMRDNCKAWVNPDMRFGWVNIQETPAPRV